MWKNENEVEQYFNEICRQFGQQKIEFWIKKLYAILYFTDHYVFKLFYNEDNLYNDAAIRHEYEWDKRMPYVEPRLFEIADNSGKSKKVLVMKRIPSESCMLNLLINNHISFFDVRNVVDQLNQITAGYKSENASNIDLYQSYLSNINTQITYLLDYLPTDTLSMLQSVLDRKDIELIFRNASRRQGIFLIHGDCFVGNMFYHNGKLIILDPISINHISKKSFVLMDYASFVTDIGLFSPNNYSFVKTLLTRGHSSNEKIILELFIILKTLVRLRFAYINEGLSDDKASTNENAIIFNNSIAFLKITLQNMRRM